jgi:alkylation response protein AidB-like acyl-CoA dehydrogenase
MSAPVTLTGQLLTACPAGGPRPAPVLMSNFAPCHGQVSLAERTDLLLAAANATRSAAAAVDIVFTAAGATTNYRRSLLQRALRDIHAVTQHIGAAPLQYESAGRMLLGLPPLNPSILF